MDLINTAIEINQAQATSDSQHDSVDKLTVKYLVIYLVVAAFLHSAEQYIGASIECWLPEQYTKNGNFVKYIKDLCWINSTRAIRGKYMYSEILNKTDAHYIFYYQWISFILVSTTFFYIVPNFIQRALHRQLNLSMKHLVTLANQYNIAAPEEQREKIVTQLKTHVLDYLTHHEKHEFTVSVIFIKLLRVIFNLLAIAYLCAVIGRGYFAFGVTYMRELSDGVSYKHNALFPLTTVCDIQLPDQNHNSFVWHSFNCMLAANIFLVFIFYLLNLLQWVAVAASAINFVVWIVRMSVRSRTDYLTAFLDGVSHDSETIQNALTIFKADGITILRLISSNSNDLVVAALVKKIVDVNDRAIYRPTYDDLGSEDLALSDKIPN